MGHMNKINRKITIFATIAAVLMFSIGYIQDSNAGTTALDQATLTIIEDCAIDILNENTILTAASQGDSRTGSFDIRNQGDAESVVELQANDSLQPDWVDGSVTPVSIILGANIDIRENTVSLGALDTEPISLTNIAPDNQGVSTGANDANMEFVTNVQLESAFFGDLFLSMDVVLLSCAVA